MCDHLSDTYQSSYIKTSFVRVRVAYVELDLNMLLEKRHVSGGDAHF